MTHCDFPTHIQVLNDNGGKFLVGGGITYADICVASILQGVSKKFPDVWTTVRTYEHIF